jgi:hypothetical protein
VRGGVGCHEVTNPCQILLKHMLLLWSHNDVLREIHPLDVAGSIDSVHAVAYTTTELLKPSSRCCSAACLHFSLLYSEKILSSNPILFCPTGPHDAINQLLHLVSRASHSSSPTIRFTTTYKDFSISIATFPQGFQRELDHRFLPKIWR